MRERSYTLKGCKIREKSYYIHIVLFEAKFGKTSPEYLNKRLIK
jgi:hypothetical protein